MQRKIMIKRTFSEYSHRLRWLWVHLTAISESSTFIHLKCFHYFRQLYYHTTMLILYVINVSLSISYAQELPGLGLTLKKVETNSRAGLKVNTGSASLVQYLTANVCQKKQWQLQVTGDSNFILWRIHPAATCEWHYHEVKEGKLQELLHNCYDYCHPSFHHSQSFDSMRLVVSIWQAAKFNWEAKLRVTPTDLEE